jgi:anion-transporting  ArsA/GET3 family ATPase
MEQTSEQLKSVFDEIAKQILAKNEEMRKVFDAMRQAIQVAEESITSRTAKILQQLEPMTKMLDVNQTIASELTNNVTSSLRTFLDQQNQIETLYNKVMSKT